MDCILSYRAYLNNDVYAAALLAFGLVGLGYVTKIVWGVSRMIAGILLPGIPLSKFGAKKGGWAVITGSTAGIGLEFSKQLARKGFNVLLVSRDASKLAKVAGEIEETNGTAIKVKTHAIDFAKASAEDYAALKAEFDELNTQIGVLVNNVGQSHSHPDFFVDMDMDEIESIMEINIASVVRVTKMIAPFMIARKNGLVLNLGSFAHYVPTALLSVYAGSKGFLSTFTQAIGSELEDHGVTVRLVNAYFITTTLSKFKRPSWLIPTPKHYVAAVLARIGSSVGAVGSQPYTCTPYTSHAIVQWLVDHVGTWGFWINMTKDSQKKVLKIWKRKNAAKKD